MLKISLSPLFVGLAAFLTVSLAKADITLKVKNENKAYTDQNSYILFEGNVQGTIGGFPLNPGISYSFAQVAAGIQLNSFRGGRIFVSLGTPLQDSPPPEATNPSIPSYHIRFDKIELTYSNTDPASVANLTSIDFFAIPISLTTYKGGQPVKSLSFSVDGNTAISDLGALTKNDPRVVLKDGDKFLRVLGPANEQAAEFYPSMQAYINAVKASNKPIPIADLFSQERGTPETSTQRYDFKGTFAKNGDLELLGSGEKIGPNHLIVIGYDDLLKGIYTSNPPYLVDRVKRSFADNDVYSAVVRDVLAGFNLGFVGSQVINTATKPAMPFGKCPSNQWWSSHKAFDFLQPKQAYYNVYSKYLSQNSDSYSFPFSDRWQSVQVPLAGNDVLEITVQPDVSADGNQ
jgi:hypothetical protein